MTDRDHWIATQLDADHVALTAMRSSSTSATFLVQAGEMRVTLHHDDFHSGNVAVRDGAYRIFDFGESFISLPWGSLLIALRDAQYILKYDAATLAALLGHAAHEWRIPPAALPAP